MGKIKKNSKTSGDGVVRPGPLASKILEDGSVRSKIREKQTSMKEEHEQQFVSDKLSKKILDVARKQQEELEDEHGTMSINVKRSQTVKLGASAATASDSDDEYDDVDDGFDYEEVKISKEDEQALQQFMSKNPPVRRTLADIITEKITEKQTEIHTQLSDAASVQVQQLDERIVSMYRTVAEILSKYRSGKLPKAFKVIPAMNNWEQILYLTDPEKWSAAAMYQATRIFASNLNAKMAQRFFNLVLFPRIRDDIEEYKKLNFHLYQAVRKSLFKPAAFFKGILLPLCESGTATLREAIIISSILAKNTIPMLHSAAAILKLAEMEYNGANSIFLRVLLDKKYALPYRVVDAVVFHFLGFQTDKRELPVLWHQCLLTFVQRYKQDISSEQKEALMTLLRAQVHEGITPEIRRELVSSKCRDEETDEPPMQFD